VTFLFAFATFIHLFLIFRPLFYRSSFSAVFFYLMPARGLLSLSVQGSPLRLTPSFPFDSPIQATNSRFIDQGSFFYVLFPSPVSLITPPSLPRSSPEDPCRSFSSVFSPHVDLALYFFGFSSEQPLADFCKVEVEIRFSQEIVSLSALVPPLSPLNPLVPFSSSQITLLRPALFTAPLFPPMPLTSPFLNSPLPASFLPPRHHHDPLNPIMPIEDSDFTPLVSILLSSSLGCLD